MNTIATIRNAMIKRANPTSLVDPDDTRATINAVDKLPEAERAKAYAATQDDIKETRKQTEKYLRDNDQKFNAWMYAHNDEIGAAGTGAAAGGGAGTLTYAGLGFIPYFQRKKLARILAALGVTAGVGGTVGYLDYRNRTAPLRENKNPSGEDMATLAAYADTEKARATRATLGASKAKDKEAQKKQKNEAPAGQTPA